MEESEDISKENSFIFKPSYILVAVDTHSSMFKVEGQPSPFKNCMKALYKLCDNLLLKPSKGLHPFSVQLYDKDEKASLADFKDSMINTTKLLKEKSCMSEDELKTDYMRDYDLDLAEFFQLCKRKFKDVGSNFYRRMLVFVTSDPDPVSGNAPKRFTALQEAKNFVENDINFELVVTNQDFEFEIFYDELFSLLSTPPLKIICEDEQGLFMKLITTICHRLYQRKLYFYPFADDTSKYLSVIKKSYIKSDRLLNNKFVAVDGSRLIRKPQGSSGDSIDTKYHLKNSALKVSDSDIEFDFHEKYLSNDRSFPVGYTLLYACKRISALGEVLTPPRILEADSTEELPFFNQFWQYCVNNDKVLVCARVLRQAEYPIPVELIPKLINFNKVFLEKRIPRADELFEPERNIKDESVVCTKQQNDITRKLVQELSYDFDISNLVDVAYVRKVEYIKSKLLGRERREIDPDSFFTVERIDEKIQFITDEFLKCFPPETGTKRKRK